MIIGNDGGYLIHYGTKGQKWGIRRYQNPDGTLTPEGKLRYSRQEKKIIKEATKDAQKALDAKMRSGVGAGVNRRHVNAEIQSKMKDDLYRETFEYQSEFADTNLAIARAKRTHAAQTGAKIAKGVLSAAGTAAIVGATIYVAKKNSEAADNITWDTPSVKQQAKVTYFPGLYK